MYSGVQCGLYLANNYCKALNFSFYCKHNSCNYCHSSIQEIPPEISYVKYYGNIHPTVCTDCNTAEPVTIYISAELYTPVVPEILPSYAHEIYTKSSHESTVMITKSFELTHTFDEHLSPSKAAVYSISVKTTSSYHSTSIEQFETAITTITPDRVTAAVITGAISLVILMVLVIIFFTCITVHILHKKRRKYTRDDVNLQGQQG